MRFDDIGLFWQDIKVERVKKEKIVRTPPEPVWLNDDYLPGLSEARAFSFDLMSDAELLEACRAKHRLVWDTEIYPNYVIIGFKNETTGKIVKFEYHSGETLPDMPKLRWILQNFTLIGFNDTEFDIPITIAALAGYSTERLMGCVNDLIIGRPQVGVPPMRSWEFFRSHKLKAFPIDHIDLLELTPLGPGLKICAGRIHAHRMADLPFVPGKNLTEDQKLILRWYWVNDLDNTKHLYRKHKVAIELREILTEEYGVDVRSKSDPQIAEAVIRKEIERRTGQKFIKKAEIIPGRMFFYKPADYLRYSSPTMQWVLGFVAQQPFIIDQYGGPQMSEALSNLEIPIGGSVYQMGSGGLHSKEKKTVHLSGADFELSDNDVESYYPGLIIQQGMFPPNVGRIFLEVFTILRDRRVAAKRSGDKATAETLKIVLNGTFGKTGERGGHSVVYYPEMMIQVTLTGQLALLMLIEMLEMNGIAVVSANTDGIVVKCPRHLVELKNQLMKDWQAQTGLKLEHKNYKAVHSRDVNNYVALYEKPDTKEPGVWQHAKAIGAYRRVTDVYPLKWNPTCEICAEAAIAFLALGTPVDETIRQCDDVRKFIEVRRVTQGACKDGEYLGKAIRWYYSTDSTGEIINAKTGYVVPRSLGAKPCMILPEAIPDDLDFDYYVDRAIKILAELTPPAESLASIAA